MGELEEGGAETGQEATSGNTATRNGGQETAWRACIVIAPGYYIRRQRKMMPNLLPGKPGLLG